MDGTSPHMSGTIAAGMATCAFQELPPAAIQSRYWRHRDSRRPSRYERMVLSSTSVRHPPTAFVAEFEGLKQNRFTEYLSSAPSTDDGE